ncbi:MAG: hypothetical protein WC211_02175 [Dehalococcoidia bacterium]
MSDLRTDRLTAVHAQVTRVLPDGQGHPRHDAHEEHRHKPEATGAEELAVALLDGNAGSLSARYEVDADGVVRIRILDTAHGQTVAVVTPEELRVLAERTGLPPGLLVRTST